MQTKVEVKTSHLCAALRFAAKNDIRFYLNGLNFRDFNGHLAIEATDGRRLIRITTSTELAEPLSAIVPVDTIKSILKAKLENLALTFEEKTATFDALTHRQTWNLIDGKYADFSLALPENWELPPMVGLFNPRYILDAWKAVFEFKGLSNKYFSFGIKMLAETDKAVYREELKGEVIEIAIMAIRG